MQEVLNFYSQLHIYFKIPFLKYYCLFSKKKNIYLNIRESQNPPKGFFAGIKHQPSATLVRKNRLDC